MMHSLATTVRPLPSITGLQEKGVRANQATSVQTGTQSVRLHHTPN